MSLLREARRRLLFAHAAGLYGAESPDALLPVARLSQAWRTIMAQPLDGIRAVDWTIWQQGPLCSSMLRE